MKNSIKHTYHIDGMSCGGCAASIKNMLTDVPGVTSVSIELKKKEVEITSSALIKADILQNALKNTHYTIAEIRSV